VGGQKKQGKREEKLEEKEAPIFETGNHGFRGETKGEKKPKKNV